MRPPLSSKGRTVSIANALSTTSELDAICSGFVIITLRRLLCYDCIQNGQNLSASVTLSKQRSENGLGHNEEGKCQLRVNE
jgi:hypothetical protein